MKLMVGAAAINVTPPPGLMMAGYGARTSPARGTHDALTSRAMVVGDTALVAVDAIGLDGASTARIAGACRLAPDRVVIAASHTHGGPHTMPGRLGGHVDQEYLARLEAAAVRAIDVACSVQRPCELLAGVGVLEGVARNRRDEAGQLDQSVPMLRAVDEAGRTVAVLASFACHPVVLDATNLQWTADYPGHARRALEAMHPDAVALFVTGCAGDVNTGHLAHQSNSLVPSAKRSHEEARRIGEAVAAAASGVALRPVGGAGVGALFRDCDLEFGAVEPDLDACLGQWRAERMAADAARRAILDIWINWAESSPRHLSAPLRVKAGALRWGDLLVACMPGEIFAATGLEVRAALPEAALVLGYCGDNPGYLPPRAEYARKGYEITEAHRFYGLPAAFAPGAAESVRDATIACGLALAGRAS